MNSRLRFRVFFFLLLDALVFGACFYKTGEATLLWREAVYPFSVLVRNLVFSAGALFLLSFLAPYELFHRGETVCSAASFEKTKRAVKDVFLIILLGIALPYLASLKTPVVKKDVSTSISFLWMPIEWHKLPMNISLLVRSFPFFAAAVAFFLLLVLWLLVSRDQKKLASLLCLLATILLASRISAMHAPERKPFFWLVFGLPFAAMAYASLRGKPRLFARMSVPAFALTVLCGFYTAFLPFSFSADTTLPAGINKIYPAPGAKKDFPTEYMRDVYVDEDAGYLYTCYGPTSGVVRLNLKTGNVDIIHTKGLLRHLWTEKNSPYLYGVDWIYDELWLIRKENFKLEKPVFLWDPVLIAPIDIELSEDSIFVVSTEYPALTRFDRKTYKKTGQINFREAGFTKFKSGAWVIARDAEKQKLFVEIGMVNAQDEFVIVRVDEKTFRVDAQAVLRGGGLSMISIPKKRSILLGDFYSNLIYEIDMDTLAVKRKIPAVPNCRSLAYDAKRDMIYAASFIHGDMVALRYRDGKILKRVFVGKKPSEMVYSSEHDALYFGSHFGVLKIDLQTFLKDL